MRFTVIGALAALAACFATGCSWRDERALPGMVLRVGIGAEPQDLDPHQVTGQPEHRILGSLFEGLADIDLTTMKPVPATAESWDISPDGRVYTFHIRPTARWSNGDPVTAHDFAYAWRRILSPKLASDYAYLLCCIRGARAFNEGKTDDFGTVGVRVTDDRTLEVTLESPTPYLLAMQVHQAWFPVHRTTIEKFGAMDERGTLWTRAGNHVGNGAFMLAEWQPNDVLRVRRNPNYWNTAKVRLDGIEFYPIDNQQTEERSFRAGILDLTSTVPPHKVAIYRREHPEFIKICPDLGTYFYRINVTRPPFTDARVRRALVMALNRDEIAHNVLKADELPAASLVPPNMPGYTPRAVVKYDPEAARALLAEAGFPGGQGMGPVEIVYNSSDAHRTIAEAVQRMWRDNLGVDVRLINQDWKVFLSAVNTLDYAVSRGGWIADVADPVNFLECFQTDVGNNRTGWSSPEYDALIRASYLEADPAKRIELLQQAEAFLLDASPIIPIYFYTWKFLQSPALKGLILNPLDHLSWNDMWLERGRGTNP
jgi:oligopeptide transport system substrate-binding protein